MFWLFLCGVALGVAIGSKSWREKFTEHILSYIENKK